METALLRGFPARGRIVDVQDWEQRDEEEAQSYYENLFLGQSRGQIRLLVENEQRLERERKHNASNVHVSDSAGNPSEMIISYRFGMRVPEVVAIMAAMVWDITIKLDESDNAESLTVEASLLTP